MSWDQFRAWQEYASVEPFGEERADLRAGIIAAATVNVTRSVNYGGKGPRPKTMQPSDFMPLVKQRDRKPRKPMDSEGFGSFAKMLKEQYGGRKKKEAKANE